MTQVGRSLFPFGLRGRQTVSSKGWAVQEDTITLKRISAYFLPKSKIPGQVGPTGGIPQLDEFPDYLKRILKKGFDEGLMKVKTRGGRERIVEYKNTLVEGPQGPMEVRGSARDITERVVAEKALKAGEAKYRKILETMEEGYYEVDLRGNLSFFNDSLAEILGYSKTELLGMND